MKRHMTMLTEEQLEIVSGGGVVLATKGTVVSTPNNSPCGGAQTALASISGSPALFAVVVNAELSLDTSAC